MSLSITGPSVHKSDGRRHVKLTKNAIECMKQVLNEIEEKNGLRSGDLIDQLDLIIRQRTRQNEKPPCQYFTKNGSACKRGAVKESNFCSVHKKCAMKYAALESLFREKFKRESEKESDAINFENLVLQSISGNDGNSSS